MVSEVYLSSSFNSVCLHLSTPSHLSLQPLSPLSPASTSDFRCVCQFVRGLCPVSDLCWSFSPRCACPGSLKNGLVLSILDLPKDVRQWLQGRNLSALPHFIIHISQTNHRRRLSDDFWKQPVIFPSFLPASRFPGNSPLCHSVTSLLLIEELLPVPLPAAAIRILNLHSFFQCVCGGHCRGDILLAIKRLAKCGLNKSVDKYDARRYEPVYNRRFYTFNHVLYLQKQTGAGLC